MSRYALLHGGVLEHLRTLPSDSADGLLCDPPYGLRFMGRAWDYDVPSVEIWREALRVLKPGAPLMAFGGSRTYHRMTVAIEDAGFEIRDCLMWLYGSGFPKSMDIAKAIDKRRDDTEDVRHVCRFLRGAMDSKGLTSADVARAFGMHSRMVDHWAARDTDSQPNLPTWEQWESLKDLLDLNDGMDAEVRRLNDRKGERGDDWKGAEIVGEYAPLKSGLPMHAMTAIDTHIRAPATDLARTWTGYGTALKPAWENLVLAAKPHTFETLIASLAAVVKESVCLLRSYVKGAACLLTSSQKDLLTGGESASAAWDAVERCSTPDDLFALMVTWPFESVRPLSLSIACSWLDILADVSKLGSTSTTETKSSLTTELKTLNCFPSEITPATIILESTYRLGWTQSASFAGRVFADASARLDCIRTLSALDLVTSTGGGQDSRLSPAFEPIILARKPLEGTMAANVARWGVGGLNIDGGRIGRVEGDRTEYGRDSTLEYPHESVALGRFERNTPYTPDALGRWPANVLLDEEAAAALDAQSGNRPSGIAVTRNGGGGKLFSGIGDPNAKGQGVRPDSGYADSGGASRFFYTSKVSKAERERGCAALPLKSAGEVTDREDGSDGLDSPRSGEGRTSGSRNHHPTLKPIALIKYLAKLILPPTENAVLLVPFSGSGSEVIGALQAGWPAVLGIEREEEYVVIARARIPANCNESKEIA